MARTEGSKTRDYPVHTLEQALVIAQAIADKGAGRQMDRLLLADAIGRTPSSSEFRRLLSSSLRYGLTAGTEKADHINPTPLGLQLTKPKREDDVAQGRRKAAQTPALFNKVYRHFNRNKWPDQSFLKNSLEKSFGVDPSLSSEVVELLQKNAVYCGILQDISGSKYIRIEESAPSNHTAGATEEEPQGDPLEVPSTAIDDLPRAESASTQKSPERVENRQIFVAHGKNRKPLDALKRILEQFGIAYKVAVDEANAGRPISAKVAALMKECSAGIFIFTKDEKFFRESEPEATAVWRPSENVVYELGAASILWDRKIIILREDGVNFPSDFRDIGYITFEDGDIWAKAFDLLKELVALGLVKVQAA